MEILEDCEGVIDGAGEACFYVRDQSILVASEVFSVCVPFKGSWREHRPPGWLLRERRWQERVVRLRKTGVLAWIDVLCILRREYVLLCRNQEGRDCWHGGWADRWWEKGGIEVENCGSSLHAAVLVQRGIGGGEEGGDVTVENGRPDGTAAAAGARNLEWKL